MRLALGLIRRLQNIDHVHVLCGALQDVEAGRVQVRTFAEELHDDLLVALENKIVDDTHIKNEKRKYDSTPIIKRLGMSWIGFQVSLRDLFDDVGEQSWAEQIAAT